MLSVLLRIVRHICLWSGIALFIVTLILRATGDHTPFNSKAAVMLLFGAIMIYTIEAFTKSKA